MVAAFSATQSFAEPIPDWVSSYNADGICYCAPDIQASLRNKIVATPVGGQAISQVCARIGKGPGLQLENGQFNFPTYHDAQCGNGPAGADAQGCEGRTENDDAVCTGTGPEWDLKSAYSKPAKPVVDTAAVETEVDKAADAALAKRLAAKARQKHERDEAALAQKLAADARAKSLRENEIQQQAAQEEIAQAEIVQTEVIQNSELEEQRVAEQLAEEARLRVVEAESATDARLAQEQAARDRQQRDEAARLQQEKLAQQKRAEQELASQEKEEDDKAARIRAAAAKAAQIRAAADAKAKQEADEQLANSAAVEKVENGAEPVIESGTGTGVRLPTYASMSNGHSGFVEFAPVTYDFGGAGASLAGGYRWAPSWQFAGRAAVVDEYSEVMLGIRKTFNPSTLKGAEVKLLAGAEYGNFDLGITELSDSGVILGGSLGYNVGRRANLSAGVKYSSFFEGDPGLFGLFLFRVVQNLDFSTRVEGGDNANLSLGLRYHY